MLITGTNRMQIMMRCMDEEIEGDHPVRLQPLLEFSPTTHNIKTSGVVGENSNNG